MQQDNGSSTGGVSSRQFLQGAGGAAAAVRAGHAAANLPRPRGGGAGRAFAG